MVSWLSVVGCQLSVVVDMIITEKIVKKKLEEVMDPELNISIIDLGLIYKIKISDKEINIDMTFTTPHCPLAPMITDEAIEKVQELGIKKVKINLVFDPPWNPDKMTKKGRKLLGI